MGKTKKTKKFATVKRMISQNDARVAGKGHAVKQDPKAANEEKGKLKLREHTQVSSSLFFKYNTNLVPPFRILLDTNFINMSIQMKLDIFKAMMECTLAKCIPCVTDCVIGELEKMGQKYRLALRLAKDPRFERLTCSHKGTYADDCLCDRVMQHKCYFVATNDKDLKRRIRKIPGIPIMYVVRGKYQIERIPEQISSVPLKGNKLG